MPLSHDGAEHPQKSANVRLERSVAEDVGTLSGGTLGEGTVAALVVGCWGGGGGRQVAYGRYWRPQDGQPLLPLGGIALR